MQSETFLHQIEDGSGLLLERENGVYSFAHLTFQEYLAAAHIKDKNLEDYLLTKVASNWWHETIRLYCALSDATNIITACIAEKRPSVQALTLAIDCRQEALQVQPSVKQQLDNLLVEGVEDSDPARRNVIAGALLNRRLKQMINIDESLYIDTTFVTFSEYQLFLDDQHIQGEYHQPDHWRNVVSSPKQGNSPLLGIRRSDAIAFCKWLTDRDISIWKYRLPSEKEQKKIEVDESITAKLMPSRMLCNDVEQESLETGLGYSTGMKKQKPIRLRAKSAG